MKVKINGKQQVCQGPISILELIENKGLSKNAVVVEYNYSILPKTQWSKTTLIQGDNIEIVSFVGGG